MDKDLFKQISKYPFIHEDTYYDSIDLEQNKTCIKKCNEKDCLALFNENENLKEHVCKKGYNNLLISLNGNKFIVNGLIYTSNTEVPKGRKDVRLDWIIERDVLFQFAHKIEEIEKYLVKKTNESIEKNFSMFHDFKTSMSVFFNCTHDIINSLPGKTFEDKLENSETSYKDLFNALELITSQLGMIDVILNPDSISFGDKREINIYKLFYKIQILFGHLATKKKNIKIELVNIDNDYIRNSLCYESIEFIPLILIDNALKYSAPNSTVKIEIEQLYHRARIKVKNIGPFVRDENVEKIFNKFYRGESAEEFSKEGVGIGLWIAQEILQRHESKLYYYKDPKSVDKIGLNIFEFELKTI